MSAPPLVVEPERIFALVSHMFDLKLQVWVHPQMEERGGVDEKEGDCVGRRG